MVYDWTQKNPKAKFWRLSVKNHKKTPAKHSIGNSISLNFMNLSTALGPILSEETDFHFYFGPDLLILYFLKILVFQKTHSLFKLIFRAMQLQRPKHNILQKTLFCTLASSTKLVLNAVPIAAGQYLWRGFTFSCQNWSYLEFQCIFNEVKTKRQIFRQSRTKHLLTFSGFSTISFTMSGTELNYYRQKVSSRVASKVAERLRLWVLGNLEI